MNIVFIIPTGVGAEIGGHAGDGNPAAQLIGSVCDRIVLHPNVVNACDINEMPPNALYVDGHTLDNFLSGNIGLQPVRANKVLVAVNPPLRVDVVNAVSACRATLGVDAEIVVMDKKMILRTGFDKQGLATGTVEGEMDLIEQVYNLDFDALAIITEIETPREVGLQYMKHGGVNPWGAVESLACQPVSKALRRPVAHAPIDDGKYRNVQIICDPRMAAEFVSIGYLFCVVKGLYKAPCWTRERSKGLWVNDIDLLVSPDMTFGTPHEFCLQNRIPILVVEENKTVLPPAKGPCIRVANYLEAAGLIASNRAGIDPRAVRRPFKYTSLMQRENP